MKTWEDVCEFLETLPGVEQAPPGDREVVRVKGKVLAFPATNARSRPPSSQEDEAFIVVRVDMAEREALLHEDPKSYFVTPHYKTYPGVIVRLSTVNPDHLRELLIESWRLVAPKGVVREWEGR